MCRDGEVLLARCRGADGGSFYALPGGDQRQYETLAECVARECFEETGYRVRVVDLAAVCEEMRAAEDRRLADPDYAYRVFFVFRCELAGAPKVAPPEPDSSQVACEWVGLDEVAALPLGPAVVRQALARGDDGAGPVYLGFRRL